MSNSNTDQLEKLVNEAELVESVDRRTPEGFGEVVNAEVLVNRVSGKVIILGEPHSERKPDGDSIHNCDARGCGRPEHVLFRGSTEVNDE